MECDLCNVDLNNNLESEVVEGLGWYEDDDNDNDDDDDDDDDADNAGDDDDDDDDEEEEDANCIAYILLT